MIKNSKPIEIFCGTGGVGKTTLATSRALFLAEKNKKVLLITIDPSKRLKQILGMSDDSSGQISTISVKIFDDNFEENFFDALLMSPSRTLKNLDNEKQSNEEFHNRILNIITKPHGGLNEIMSMVELHQQYKKGIYDTIILDTPPGKHFVDFLNSATKINNFFDKSFIEIFKYLGKSEGPNKKSTGIFTVFISAGIKKLLGYLEKVTGKEFVDTFVEAILIIYKSKQGFIEAMSMAQKLKEIEYSNWILVTSTKQHKIDEANHLKNDVSHFSHKDKFLAINKSLLAPLKKWNPQDNQLLSQLRDNMLSNEELLHDFAATHFSTILEFPEIMAPSPRDHVRRLSDMWS